MKLIGNIILLAAAVVAAGGCVNMSLARGEREIIGAADENGIMRVLTVNDCADSLTLRMECADFADCDLERMFRDSLSPCAKLASQMVATVTSPEQDGVGIAGPQVGICRRIVAVQRFDKTGEPFEVYPNIRIIESRGRRRTGPEGCLSIPGRRGLVERWDTVVISYAKAIERIDRHNKGMSEDGGASAQGWKYATETVGGFTAVIFQHECDHLDGILYIDRESTETRM